MIREKVFLSGSKREETDRQLMLYVKRASLAGKAVWGRKNMKGLIGTRKIENLAGFVRIGCVVEVFPERLVAMFFIMMTEGQLTQFIETYPTADIKVLRQNDTVVVALTWKDYLFFLRQVGR